MRLYTVKEQNIVITFQDVKDQMQLIDTNKSYGPDCIPPILIKEGGDPMCTVLLTLFNFSLNARVFPDVWKQANVLPLFKKDDQSDVKNYRPISILSVVIKVFEKIVFKYIYNHLHVNFILSPMQSGFLPGRSCVTQLIEVYHKFCEYVDCGKEVRVIFLDISKAFDKVWHKGLIFKLHKAGISGNVLAWLQNS